MTKQADEIAALTAEIEKLKAAQPTVIDPTAEGKWRDEMRKIADDRALRDGLSFFSRADLAAMRAATPDSEVRAIVREHRNVPRGPTAECIITPCQHVSNVRVGGGTGWQHHIPLRNGLGQGK